MNSRKWLNFLNDDEPKVIEYNPSLSLLTESEFQDLPDYSDVLLEVEDILDEKRKKYPACRPTASACKKSKGTKGKSWGKKGSKKEGKTK
tara:strand:- start:4309 stop:4578 length:270 start_codon:yes stop_codon:yes gene_type:complete